MKLQTHWQNLDADGKRALAEALDTSVAYLSQLANGHRQSSQQMALRIERMTQNQVTRYDLRPDLNPHESLPAVVSSEAQA